MEPRTAPGNTFTQLTPAEFQQMVQERMAELAELSKPRPPEIDPENPGTWPQGMQAHRAYHLAEGPSIADWPNERKLYELKADALMDAVLHHLGDVYIFADAGHDYLIEHLPEASVEGALVRKLDGYYHRLILDAVEACMDLVPRLAQLMPYDCGADLLAELLKDDRPAEAPHREDNHKEPRAWPKSAGE